MANAGRQFDLLLGGVDGDGVERIDLHFPIGSVRSEAGDPGTDALIDVRGRSVDGVLQLLIDQDSGSPCPFALHPPAPNWSVFSVRRGETASFVGNAAWHRPQESE